MKISSIAFTKEEFLFTLKKSSIPILAIGALTSVSAFFLLLHSNRLLPLPFTAFSPLISSQLLSSGMFISSFGLALLLIASKSSSPNPLPSLELPQICDRKSNSSDCLGINPKSSFPPHQEPMQELISHEASLSEIKKSDLVINSRPQKISSVEKFLLLLEKISQHKGKLGIEEEQILNNLKQVKEDASESFFFDSLFEKYEIYANDEKILTNLVFFQLLTLSQKSLRALPLRKISKIIQQEYNFNVRRVFNNEKKEKNDKTIIPKFFGSPLLNAFFQRLIYIADSKPTEFFTNESERLEDLLTGDEYFLIYFIQFVHFRRYLFLVTGNQFSLFASFLEKRACLARLKDLIPYFFPQDPLFDEWNEKRLNDLKINDLEKTIEFLPKETLKYFNDSIVLHLDFPWEKISNVNYLFHPNLKINGKKVDHSSRLSKVSKEIISIHLINFEVEILRVLPALFFQDESLFFDCCNEKKIREAFKFPTDDKERKALSQKLRLIPLGKSTSLFLMLPAQTLTLLSDEQLFNIDREILLKCPPETRAFLTELLLLKGEEFFKRYIEALFTELSNPRSLETQDELLIKKKQESSSLKEEDFQLPKNLLLFLTKTTLPLFIKQIFEEPNKFIKGLNLELVDPQVFMIIFATSKEALFTTCTLMHSLTMLQISNVLLKRHGQNNLKSRNKFSGLHLAMLSKQQLLSLNENSLIYFFNNEPLREFLEFLFSYRRLKKLGLEVESLESNNYYSLLANLIKKYKDPFSIINHLKTETIHIIGKDLFTTIFALENEIAIAQKKLRTLNPEVINTGLKFLNIVHLVLLSKSQIASLDIKKLLDQKYDLDQLFSFLEDCQNLKINVEKFDVALGIQKMNLLLPCLEEPATLTYLSDEILEDPGFDLSKLNDQIRKNYGNYQSLFPFNPLEKALGAAEFEIQRFHVKTIDTHFCLLSAEQIVALSEKQLRAVSNEKLTKHKNAIEKAFQIGSTFLKLVSNEELKTRVNLLGDLLDRVD